MKKGMRKIPHWIKDDGRMGYSIIRCPNGHDNLDELKRTSIVEPERRVRVLFKCRECEAVFSEKDVYIYSEESLDYEQPGVVSGKTVEGLTEYEKRKKNLRKKVFGA